MCSIQWAESVVTGTADAFDFAAVTATKIANAQVYLKYYTKILATVKD